MHSEELLPLFVRFLDRDEDGPEVGMFTTRKRSDDGAVE